MCAPPGEYSWLYVKLTQGTRHLDLNSGNGVNFRRLGGALRSGMTLMASYWSGEWSMKWLHGGVCSADHMSCADRITYREFALCDGVTECAY